MSSENGGDGKPNGKRGKVHTFTPEGRIEKHGHQILTSLTPRVKTKEPVNPIVLQAIQNLKAQQAVKAVRNTRYINRETGRTYEPHHPEERDFFGDEITRYLLAKGGEGSGKSVLGVIRDLVHVRTGCAGIMGSPDFEHFKKSLWQEFRRWVNLDWVVEKDRYKLSLIWEPQKQFELHFYNIYGTTTTLYCGGFDDPKGWEGPNINFAHFDEARRHTDANMLKVLDGRIRIPGPLGEKPQLWLTTTPEKHWLYDYFGPIEARCENCGADFQDDAALSHEVFFAQVCPTCRVRETLLATDERIDFKRNARVMTLHTQDNEDAGNLDSGYTQQRAHSLTAQEIRIRLLAEWEAEEAVERFLPDMLFWDQLQEKLPPLRPDEPLVLALDAATGRADSPSDCFALVGVTRHPDPTRRHNAVAIRIAMVWQAKAGKKIDFRGSDLNPGPIPVVKKLCAEYAVQQIAYDPTELRLMVQDLQKEGVGWFREFPNGVGNAVKPGHLIADKQFLDLILQRRLAHDGNATLRAHVDNADRKLGKDEHTLRIVKRIEAKKIDLTVACSKAACECLRLRI